MSPASGAASGRNTAADHRGDSNALSACGDQRQRAVGATAARARHRHLRRAQCRHRQKRAVHRGIRAAGPGHRRGPRHSVARQRWRTALVLAVALGEEGVLAVGKVVGSRSRVLRRLGKNTTPPAGSANSTTTSPPGWPASTPSSGHHCSSAGTSPAGAGAVIGGIGNRALGRKVVANARIAFGPRPRNGRLSTEPSPTPLTRPARSRPSVRCRPTEDRPAAKG